MVMNATQALVTSPPQDMEAIVSEALEAVMARFPRERRAEALRALRQELEQCLTEASSEEDPVAGMGLRARLAAAIARAN